MQFTVYLPEHKTRVEYPREKFMSLYPGSLIGLVLSNTTDTEVPLSHSLVTSEILQILSRIVEGGVYPALGEYHRKAFDYLGIDMPDFVYTGVYKEFMDQDGRSDMILKDLMNKEYDVLFAMASMHRLRSLLEYIFLSTEASDTLASDSKGFLDLITAVPHSPVLEDLAILTYTTRDIRHKFTLTDDEKFSTITKITQQILLCGYPALYELVTSEHGGYVVNKNFISNLIMSIGTNPAHFKGYNECIRILFQGEEDGHRTWGLLTHQLYTIIRDEGPNMVDQLRNRVMQARSFSRVILPGLLWMTIMTNQSGAYTDFLQYIRDEETEVEMPSLDGFYEMCRTYATLIPEPMWSAIFPPS